MTYEQHNKLIRQQRRIKRLARGIAFTVLVAVPFIVGIFVGRATVPTIEAGEEYTAPAYVIPDACGLEVVVCEGEEA